MLVLIMAATSAIYCSPQYKVVYKMLSEFLRLGIKFITKGY